MHMLYIYICIRFSLASANNTVHKITNILTNSQSAHTYHEILNSLVQSAEILRYETAL